jgi:tetratricopeptide (TPR) repeat protein
MRVSRFVSVVCVACVALAVAGCSQDRSIATSLMNQGLAALNRGDSTEGLEKLEEASMADPKYADPAYYAGQAYQQKYSDYDKAVQQYEIAVKRDPENAQFLYRLGAALADGEKHEPAIEQLKLAVASHEEFPKAWYRKGVSEIALKRYPDAVASLTKSIEFGPKMKIGGEDPGGAAYHALGDLYLRFRFHDKALKVYENGLENNPGVAQLLRGKGLSQIKLGRHDEAVATLTEAVGADNRNGVGYFNLAVAQHKAGKTEDALKTLDQFESRADGATDRAQLSAAQGLRTELMTALERAKAPE